MVWLTTTIAVVIKVLRHREIRVFAVAFFRGNTRVMFVYVGPRGFSAFRELHELILYVSVYCFGLGLRSVSERVVVIITHVVGVPLTRLYVPTA